MFEKLRNLSQLLLDLLFGKPEAQPQPEEEDLDQSWKRWLGAATEQEEPRQMKLVVRTLAP